MKAEIRRGFLATANPRPRSAVSLPSLMSLFPHHNRCQPAYASSHYYYIVFRCHARYCCYKNREDITEKLENSSVKR